MISGGGSTEDITLLLTAFRKHLPRSRTGEDGLYTRVRIGAALVDGDTAEHSALRNALGTMLLVRFFRFNKAFSDYFGLTVLHVASHFELGGSDSESSERGGLQLVKSRDGRHRKPAQSVV